MTRTALQPIVGERMWFRGHVEMFSRRDRNFVRRELGRRSKNRPKVKVLLISVVFMGSGAFAADHVWVRVGQWSKGLREGDEITFSALVTKYIKGNVSHTDDALQRPLYQDYKLTEIKNVRIECRHGKSNDQTSG